MAMRPPTEAQIYLAEQRGCTQLAGYRSFHTFNFVDYRQESRQPFGPLVILNDDTLLAGKSHAIIVAEATEILLLPVVGGIELVDALGESVFLGAGEFFQFTAIPGQEYRVVNPFEVEAINYLLIGLKADPSSAESLGHFPATTFDLDNRNQLQPLFSSADQNRLGFIGKYGGRQEGVYPLSNPQKSIFVFILQGAFEVQNRLLHARDGLALWQVEEVEFEALSNNAILLLMEL